jgi:uncharacterized protein (UPF0216 family)
MPRELHPENLRSLKELTTEEVRKIASKGGKKSVQVRREKKQLSEYFKTNIIDKTFKVKIDNKEVSQTGGEMVCDMFVKVIERADSASVQAVKVILEATEGSKVHNTGEMDSNITIKFE